MADRAQDFSDTASQYRLNQPKNPNLSKALDARRQKGLGKIRSDTLKIDTNLFLRRLGLTGSAKRYVHSDEQVTCSGRHFSSISRQISAQSQTSTHSKRLSRMCSVISAPQSVMHLRLSRPLCLHIGLILNGTSNSNFACRCI